MKNDNLGDRIKGYEDVNRNYLLRRTPVIIRVDGKAFHTYTKKFTPKDDRSLNDGPFSHILHDLMMNTAAAMQHQIQNATVAYTQSDEISILLNDWKTLTTDQWYGGNIQKITSVSAAMASSFFNFFLTRVKSWPVDESVPVAPRPIPTHVGEIPLFDARVFNLPKEEVTNYFVWRQKDATRNSVNMLARYHFSHKQLHGKNISQVQDMLMLEKGVNWNDLDVWKKRGACVIPNPNSFDSSSPNYQDEEIPIFTQDREYIEQFLKKNEEDMSWI